MKFLDEAKIYLKAGDGGNGCVAFRREKYVEFGGPSGGNGGKGGDIIFKAVPNVNTLIDFRYQQHFKAQRGGGGEGSDRTGRGGKDLLIKVPTGTVILAEDKETVLADLDQDDKTIVLAHGGSGGFGNAHFKSSTNQAPRRADPGKLGDERAVWLRLKLIADVGLVGLPNAGKSTLLAALTRARPKIASYPFTTLHPGLGVVYVRRKEFIMADLPGLIEGAHAGQGLGHRFLGHVERCRVIVHLIDGTQEDVSAAYKTIRKELKMYGEMLDQKEEVVVLNKIDLLSDAEIKKKQQSLKRISKKDIFLISGMSGTGLKELSQFLWDQIEAKRK